MSELKLVNKSESCALYSLAPIKPSKVKCFVASTPETRTICNDPFLYGVRYTRALQNACMEVLRSLTESKHLALIENESTVLNILRGGLNFGLRDALADAFRWNNHTAAFITAQRARREPEPDKWYITESSYRKVYLPKRSAIIFGDVVATGTSLEFALKSLLEIAENSGSEVSKLVFFTIGGPRSEEVLAIADEICRQKFPNYEGAVVVYFEGRFAVAENNTPITIKISGTDLLRRDSALAPEFVASQYDDPAYPLERCTIYDAGSRSFWIPEYLEDVHDYWTQVEKLASSGVEFESLVHERCPELDTTKFPAVDLAELCKRQLSKAHYGA